MPVLFAPPKGGCQPANMLQHHHAPTQQSLMGGVVASTYRAVVVPTAHGPQRPCSSSPSSCSRFLQTPSMPPPLPSCAMRIPPHAQLSRSGWRPASAKRAAAGGGARVQLSAYHGHRPDYDAEVMQLQTPQQRQQPPNSMPPSATPHFHPRPPRPTSAARAVPSRPASAACARPSSAAPPGAQSSTAAPAAVCARPTSAGARMQPHGARAPQRQGGGIASAASSALPGSYQGLVRLAAEARRRLDDIIVGANVPAGAGSPSGIATSCMMPDLTSHPIAHRARTMQRAAADEYESELLRALRAVASTMAMASNGHGETGHGNHSHSHGVPHNNRGMAHTNSGMTHRLPEHTGRELRLQLASWRAALECSGSIMQAAHAAHAVAFQSLASGGGGYGGGRGGDGGGGYGDGGGGGRGGVGGGEQHADRVEVGGDRLELAPLEVLQHRLAEEYDWVVETSHLALASMALRLELASRLSRRLPVEARPALMAALDDLPAEKMLATLCADLTDHLTDRQIEGMRSQTRPGTEEEPAAATAAAIAAAGGGGAAARHATPCAYGATPHSPSAARPAPVGDGHYSQAAQHAHTPGEADEHTGGERSGCSPRDAAGEPLRVEAASPSVIASSSPPPNAERRAAARDPPPSIVQQWRALGYRCVADEAKAAGDVAGDAKAGEMESQMESQMESLMSLSAALVGPPTPATLEVLARRLSLLSQLAQPAFPFTSLHLFERGAATEIHPHRTDPGPPQAHPRPTPDPPQIHTSDKRVVLIRPVAHCRALRCAGGDGRSVGLLRPSSGSSGSPMHAMARHERIADASDAESGGMIGAALEGGRMQVVPDATSEDFAQHAVNRQLVEMLRMRVSEDALLLIPIHCHRSANRLIAEETIGGGLGGGIGGSIGGGADGGSMGGGGGDSGSRCGSPLGVSAAPPGAGTPTPVGVLAAVVPSARLSSLRPMHLTGLASVATHLGLAIKLQEEAEQALRPPPRSGSPTPRGSPVRGSPTWHGGGGNPRFPGPRLAPRRPQPGTIDGEAYDSSLPPPSLSARIAELMTELEPAHASALGQMLSRNHALGDAVIGQLTDDALKELISGNA